MHRVLSLLFPIVSLACAPATAQETCDVKTKLNIGSKGAYFMQMEYCGDADLTTLFTCSRGSRKIKVVLPISAFDHDDSPGQSFKNTFKFNAVVTERTLKTTPAVKGGAGDVGASITLEVDDPLWKALMTPDLDIESENNNSTSRVGTFSVDGKKLDAFKKACGL